MNQSKVPEGWEEKTLGSIAKRIISGSTPSTSNSEYWDGEIVWVTPDDLSQNDSIYMSSSSRRITSKGLSHSSARLIPRKSIVMSSRAPIGYVAIMNVEYATNQGCKSLELKDSVPEFIYYSLTFNMPRIKQQGEGTTFAEISKTQLEKVSLILPKSSGEQRRIANVLQTVDRVIEKTKQLVLKHKKMKEGLMRDLFQKIINAPKISFGDRRYVSLVTKGTTPTTYGYPFVEWGINFIKVESISKEGRFIKSQFEHISEKANAFLKRSQLKNGDILFSIAGAIGRCATVDKSILPANTNQALAIIRCKGGVDIDYIRYALDSFIIQDRVRSLNVQLAQANLSLENISNFEIPYPSSDVREQLVRSLASIDAKLLSEEMHLSKLQRMKTGLMQDLLTGKVRVAA